MFLLLWSLLPLSDHPSLLEHLCVSLEPLLHIHSSVSQFHLFPGKTFLVNVPDCGSSCGIFIFASLLYWSLFITDSTVGHVRLQCAVVRRPSWERDWGTSQTGSVVMPTPVVCLFFASEPHTMQSSHFPLPGAPYFGKLKPTTFV